MVFAALLGTKTRRRSSRGGGGRPRLPSPLSSNSNSNAASVASGSSDPTTAAHPRDFTESQRSAAAVEQTNTGHGHGNGRGHGHEYISDESQLRPVQVEPPDLRELNNSLEALAAVFPDVQIDVFREMLTSFEGESRLALVADALLKNRVMWVKGRWRAVGATTIAGSPTTADVRRDGGTAAAAAAAPADTLLRQRDPELAGSDFTAAATSSLPSRECFRSVEYKKAVKNLAFHEFKGLSRSSISAVLAEQNYSYLEARRTLVEMSSKSWRFTMTSLFFRRKHSSAASSSTDAAESHPLVVWKSTGKGSIMPTIKSTGSAELDRELFNELVAPLKRQAKATQEEKDRVLAIVLNTEEAEEAEATHECACCFTTSTFEEITTCNGDEAHVVCFRCVQHAISEAVFGQGWQRSIDKELGTLTCPAMTCSDYGECRGRIPSDQMHRAMLEEKRGAEMLHKLDQRLAEHSLVSSGLPLVRCPFCSYAEVDDPYVPLHESELRVRVDSILNLVLLILCVGLITFLIPLVLLSSFACLLLTSRRTLGAGVAGEMKAALARHRRRRRGLKFRCGDPGCGRVSCLSCGKGWTDVHVCHESALVALRTQVEQAMSMAIKRVCPRCNTSFVKTAGCNKLTCPCGYKMCYVCRKDIGDNNNDGEGNDVGYRHFCDHFRPEGDPRPCDQCNRCNLWESEDTDAVLRAAKEEAERKWLEAEGRELNGTEKTFLETGVLAGGLGAEPLLDGSLGRPGVAKGKGALEAALLFATNAVTHWPSLPEICDMAVETIFM